MNDCDTHEHHETLVVQCQNGLEMEVYDRDLYQNTYGYCTGDDDVSRTLILYGRWEEQETAMVLPCFQGGHVLDLGSHIGWFTLLAATRGCHVTAFDGDAENLEVLRRNTERNGVADLVETHLTWIDEGFVAPTVEGPIDLVKVDLEGVDAFAVHGCDAMIAAGQVRNLLVEISPVFNDSYPDLVEWLVSCGYTPFTMEDRPLSGNEAERRAWVSACRQTNLLFRKS